MTSNFPAKGSIIISTGHGKPTFISPSTNSNNILVTDPSQPYGIKFSDPETFFSCLTGLNCCIGATGSQGATGAQGIQGNTGPQGPAGTGSGTSIHDYQMLNTYATKTFSINTSGATASLFGMTAGSKVSLTTNTGSASSLDYLLIFNGSIQLPSSNSSYILYYTFNGTPDYNSSMLLAENLVGGNAVDHAPLTHVYYKQGLTSGVVITPCIRWISGGGASFIANPNGGTTGISASYMKFIIQGN